MEEKKIDCTHCEALPPKLSVYTSRACRLCGSCSECLNEAGYCVPCSEKIDYPYSLEDATPV